MVKSIIQSPGPIQRKSRETPVGSQPQTDDDLSQRAQAFASALHKDNDTTEEASTTDKRLPDSGYQRFSNDQKTVAHSAQATNGGEVAVSHQSIAADQSQENTASAVTAMGDAILQSLQTQAPFAPSPETVEAPHAAAETLNERMQKFAAKVLVADPGSGLREVRITLNKSFLAGAEIRIRHDQGRLNIDLVATTADSQRFLNSHRSELQQTLQERLHDEVAVHVQLSDSNHHGQQNDGRSRQQRNVYEEWRRDSE